MKLVVRLTGTLLLVAGCSFEHGVVSPAGDGSSGPDAATELDAAVVADAPHVQPMIDAPPPCADDDGDGVCNDVDDWPCGAKPAAPGATMTMTGNGGQTSITITNVNLNGTGRLAVGPQSTLVSLSLSYQITDTACSQACVDQIEIGWVPGGRAGCVFDNTVSPSAGASGTVNVQIRTPMTRQVYDLRANIGQNYSCNHQGASGWWGGQTPPASRTIAKLCVH